MDQGRESGVQLAAAERAKHGEARRFRNQCDLDETIAVGHPNTESASTFAELAHRAYGQLKGCNLQLRRAIARTLLSA
jgi:hypothetical protein